MGVNFAHPTVKWKRRILSPSEIAPYAWYDASDTSTITHTAGSVTQLSDKSGFNRHLTQANSAVRPTTGSTQNGLNALRFSQSSVDTARYLDASTVADWNFLHNGTDNFIICTAARSDIGTTVLYYLASTQTTPSNAGMRFGPNASTGTFARLTFICVSASGGAIPTVSGTNYGADVTVAGQWLAGSFFGNVATGRFHHFLTSPRNNFVGAAYNATNYSTAAATIPLRLGTLGTGVVNTKWTGYFGEMIIVKGAEATAQNAFALRNYLRDKWGTL